MFFIDYWKFVVQHNTRLRGLHRSILAVSFAVHQQRKPCRKHNRFDMPRSDCTQPSESSSRRGSNIAESPTPGSSPLPTSLFELLTPSSSPTTLPRSSHTSSLWPTNNGARRGLVEAPAPQLDLPNGYLRAMSLSAILDECMQQVTDLEVTEPRHQPLVRHPVVAVRSRRGTSQGAMTARRGDLSEYGIAGDDVEEEEPTQ